MQDLIADMCVRPLNFYLILTPLVLLKAGIHFLTLKIGTKINFVNVREKLGIIHKFTQKRASFC